MRSTAQRGMIKAKRAAECASEPATTNAKSQQGARSVGLEPVAGVGWERALYE